MAIRIESFFSGPDDSYGLPYIVAQMTLPDGQLYNLSLHDLEMLHQQVYPLMRQLLEVRDDMAKHNMVIASLSVTPIILVKREECPE